MGSVGTEQLTGGEDDFVVLVTGFGPFGQRWAVNPSWEIASRLPPLIPVISKTDAGTTSSTLAELAAGKQIRILVHPSPIRVSYSAVRKVVPELWAQYPRIDYMIHIGMASGRSFYSIERRAHRRGYNMGDVDGVVLGDEALAHEDAGTKWPWADLPDEILTDVNVDDVWRRWRTARVDDDVRVSEDAGRYLCDFIFYNSLAGLTQRGEEKRALFLHVPVESDELALKKGGEITVDLIRSIVVSGLMKSVITEGKEKDV